MYILDVDNDNDGSPRGDNKNDSVATINQNTEVSATRIRGSSLHGDGSAIEGLTQQEVQEMRVQTFLSPPTDCSLLLERVVPMLTHQVHCNCNCR